MTRATGLAPCLMIQGTGSGVGKSMLTTALCRIFARAGYRVAPFKAQNMSLNACVAAGGEIGRAQAAQAEAAGVEASVDMNPVLLKPETDRSSQVVVSGRVWGRADARDYLRMREAIWPVVAESLDRLRQAHDLVLIEGAGSPAEINLREHDMVNMPVAHLAEAPVLLVGDIDRGGVFAALVGTLALLSRDDRRRIAGFVVNKFRGDRALLSPGLAALSMRTGVPVLGVVPHFDARLLPPEDSLDIESLATPGESRGLDIAVVRLPWIANFDDFEALGDEPGVGVRLARAPAHLGAADLVILPGSKNTLADLAWVRQQGLARAIAEAAAAGRYILGVCGGYQMLGRTVRDPAHLESSRDEAPGLGLLPVETTLTAPKTVVRVTATGGAASRLFAGVAHAFPAYEIHLGHTAAGGRPVFRIVSRDGRPVADPDGTVHTDLPVEGTYLHGALADARVRRRLLAGLAERKGIAVDPRWGREVAADRYERLADIVSGALDVTAVARLVGLAFPRIA